jgi:hypothetical protein
MFVTFGTVTFAWISLSTINNIEGLSLAASGGDELQISLDGVNYNSQLTAEQLYEMFENIRLVDVTSTDGIYFETGGLRDKEEAVPNEHYLTFDLWFQTSVRENHVYLVNDVSNQVAYDTSAVGTFVISHGVMWTAKYDFWYGPEESDMIYKGEEDRYYASDSVRISILELKDETNENDLRNEDDLKKFLFDPSGDELRGYGVPYGQYSYFIARTRYFIGLPNDIQEVSYRLTEIDPNNPYQALDDESLIAVLQETGEITESGKTIYRGKVRISIWIEGWDADAFDAVENDRLKIQLQFKALIPPHEQGLT